MKNKWQRKILCLGLLAGFMLTACSSEKQTTEEEIQLNSESQTAASSVESSRDTVSLEQLPENLELGQLIPQNANIAFFLTAEAAENWVSGADELETEKVFSLEDTKQAGFVALRNWPSNRWVGLYQDGKLVEVVNFPQMVDEKKYTLSTDLPFTITKAGETLVQCAVFNQQADNWVLEDVYQITLTIS